MNNREAFEAWAEKELLPLDRRDSDHYRYNLTNRAWAGWKAALASQAQQYHSEDALNMVPSQAHQTTLLKHQPCGCVICTCEHETQCQGCGAKNCGTHAVGKIPHPVYLQSQAQQNTKPFAYMQLVNNEPLRSVALFEREKRGMEDHINLTYPDLKVSWVELFTAPAQAELSSNPLQLELEPYAYDVPTEDGTELAYAIYFTKYNNPLPEGAIPLYLQSQAQQATNLSEQLREYAGNSGYSHNDYADTMIAAASEIERLTASQAQQEPKTPNLDHVICPACAHDFRAIPENVQSLLTSAGFEPPFLSQAQQTESQWISVEERLPEENTYVLCSYKRFGEWLVHEGSYDEKGRFTLSVIDAKVRYWMPLPPAPEGDNEQPMNEVNKPEGE